MKIVIQSLLAIGLSGVGFSAVPDFWSSDVDLAQAEVYISTNATVPETEAARMLIRSQAMLAGGEDPKTNAVPKVTGVWPSKGIVIGWQGSSLMGPFALELGLRDWYGMPKKGADEIVIRQKGEVVILAANSPQGTCYCVGELLYRNGARFLHNGGTDGGDGTFLEFMTGLKAPRDWRYSPDVRIRDGFRDRCARSKRTGAALDAELVGKNVFAVFNGAIGVGPLDGGRARDWVGIECIQPPVAEFKKHPEWFPEIDGKRWRPTGGGWDWVVEGCWMSKGFFDWVVGNTETRIRQKGGEDKILRIDMTTSDGGRKCECAGCRELRSSYPDTASWYWDYQTKVANEMARRHPRMLVEASAYLDGLCYPKLGPKVLQGIQAVVYCPYRRCFIHPYSDKTCPTNKADLDRMAEWKQADVPVGDFDYLFDAFNPAMNMPVWELAADIVDYWRAYNGRHDISSIYSENAVEGGCGAKSRIAHYVFVRKLWNGDETADAHLADWCRVGLGEAAEELLPFFRAEAVAWTNQPVHITACFNNPLGTAKTFLTDALERQGKAAFERGEKLLAGAAATGDARKRELVRKQLATLLWEKQVFEEWVALKEKALKTSLSVILEADAADPAAFARCGKHSMRTMYPKWQGEDVTHSFAQFYRTKDALRIRVTSNDPYFAPQKWHERRCAEENFRWDMPAGLIELFLGAPGQSGYYHLAVTADGAVYDARVSDAKGFDSSLWSVESAQRTGFWQLDFTVPWTVFGLSGVKSGDVFKAVVINNGHKKNAKNGEIQGLSVGVPFPAAHDIASGADLMVDDGAVRRPDAP